MKKEKAKKLKIVLALLVFTSMFSIGFLVSQFSSVESSVDNASVIRAIDGDTLETSLGKVRLLGINNKRV